MNPMLAHAVDGVLSRLARTYAAEFAAKFEAVAPVDLRSTWCQELSGFTHELDAIAWAERHLPERCPNAVQFRNLCHQAPRVGPAAPMTGSKDPVRGPTQAERDQLRELRDSIRAGQLFAKPSRQWAHDLVACHERGQRNGKAFAATPASLAMALEVAEADGRRNTQPPADDLGYDEGELTP